MGTGRLFFYSYLSSLFPSLWGSSLTWVHYSLLGCKSNRQKSHAAVYWKHFWSIHIKSCIVFSGSQTSFFQSYCGVRQGENLSPALFSLFLNDLEDYLNAHHCKGISVDYTDEDISVYLKILILLYADNTVIFGTDPHSFQDNLNIFYEYCQLWKLNINYNQRTIGPVSLTW